MALKLRCNDYGFECDYTLSDEGSTELLEEFRRHFEEEHGIEYTFEVITQMVMNRGYSLESIKNKQSP